MSDDGRYALVCHASYSDESGSCGHMVSLVDATGARMAQTFVFRHPYGTDHETFARDLAASLYPSAPLRWDDCCVYDE